MTNDQILSLALGLPQINPPEMIGSFNYAISENTQRVERVAKNIRAHIKDSEPMEEFREQLKDLQEKHSEKDKDGKPVQRTVDLPNGSQIIQYSIPSAKDPDSEFSVKLAELNEKYKDDIDEQNERMKFLQEEDESFEPFWISVDELPNGLTRDEMDLVHLLIKKD